MDHALSGHASRYSPATVSRRPPRTNSFSSASWYWLLLGFIGTVSAYDAYLTYIFRVEMPQMEENPVGWALIQLEPEGLSYFFAAKTFGTIVVLTSFAAAEYAGHSGLRFPRHLFMCIHQRMPYVSQKLRRLDHTFRSYRQTILTSVASFQAWLLWYLTM